MNPAGRILLLGGARSGKSTAAEILVRDFPTTYVATSRRSADDPEWERRIDQHQRRRPRHWRTVATQDLPTWIGKASPEQPVLIDCLTLWLSHTLDDLGAWTGDPAAQASAVTAAEARVAELAAAVADSAGGLVLVSNEVGSGVVPATGSGRVFRDLLGTCNAAVAAACDEVSLVVAGCMVPIKPAGGH